MPDVTQVIDGYPAHVHAHFPGMNGFEFLFLTTQGIKNL
ncbi:Hypothetical protein SMB2099_1110 [Serratia marcescens SMB2099]|nr:Hypothetical protein SMB2099_1110 [Serratia marcescens SMB2099]